MTTISCNICIEPFNSKNHSKITCQYCNFEACKNCCEKYILMEITPKCMNVECNREWTRKFITQSFSKTFVNTKLKHHKEKNLFDKEIALLPATQVIVEKIIKVEKLHIENNNNRETILELRKSIYNNNMNIVHLQSEINRIDITQQRSKFVRACPSETCRGFLSSQWKCGICENWTCPECHVLKGKTRNGQHVCDPNNIATAILLDSDTKQCPNCGFGIFKIEGCDQLWCTQCHTAFSWRTGQIEHNSIHNPHYYEWLRMNGNNIPININNNNCERTLTDNIPRIIEYLIDETENIDLVTKFRTSNKIYKITRNIIHLRTIEFPRYTNNADTQQRIHQDLRIKYMLNKIDENNFKTQLQRINKKQEKNQEILNILEMTYYAVTDIIYRIQHQLNDTPDHFNIIIFDELQNLVEYSNECFLDISKTYNSIFLRFDDVFSLYTK
jgi:ribosomal protein S27AE